MSRRMYNRNGWVDVDHEHAAETCQRHPREWTLKPWKRPDGAPNVNVPDNWALIQESRRIDLAREIGGPDVNSAIVADEVIRNYLAGTRHPTAELLQNV